MKEPHNQLSANVKELLSHSTTDMELRQNNYNLVNKHEFGCHFVSKNPRFLASISYPNIAQDSYQVTEPRIVSDIRKESRAPQNRSKNQDGMKMHPKKVSLAIMFSISHIKHNDYFRRCQYYTLFKKTPYEIFTIFQKYQGAISSSSIDSLVTSNLLLMTSYQSNEGGHPLSRYNSYRYTSFFIDLI